MESGHGTATIYIGLHGYLVLTVQSFAQRFKLKKRLSMTFACFCD